MQFAAINTMAALKRILILVVISTHPAQSLLIKQLLSMGWLKVFILALKEYGVAMTLTA